MDREIDKLGALTILFLGVAIALLGIYVQSWFGIIGAVIALAGVVAFIEAKKEETTIELKTDEKKTSEEKRAA